MGKKKLECPVVSQICTLWPLRFHQESFIFSLMQPIGPDGYPPTAVGYPPTTVNYPPIAVGYLPTAVSYPPRFFNKKNLVH